MTWTIERSDRAKVLHEQGCSASIIAADLGNGITRNAVIGHIHRRGWTRGRRPIVAHASGPKRHKPRTPRNVQRTALATRLDQAKPHYSDAIEKVDLPADVSPFACTLAELTEDTCRWPLGTPDTPEFRFCGAKPFASQPYCPRHCSIAYQAPAPRRTLTDEERQERARQARAASRKEHGLIHSTGGERG